MFLKLRFIVTIGISWLISSGLQARQFTPDELQILSDALKDSYQRQQVMDVFAKQDIQKIEGMVRHNITKPIKLSMDRYGHFSESYAIDLAKKFKRKWRTVLGQAQARYKVDKNVIVAILLVETSFGRFTGKFPLLAIFPSIYIDSWIFTNSPEFQQIEAKLQRRFLRKQAWALQEIEAIMAITKKFPNLKLTKLKASYAGAFGKAQFLPSSYLNYAVAYMKGMTPNLHHEPDAIFSVANYLAGHGYRGSINSKPSYQAIFSYNRSDVYVKTVTKVAGKLNKTLARTE